MIISKYCASGNDFLIFHSFLEQNRAKMAVELCNRFYGIGADGMVVVLPYESFTMLMAVLLVCVEMQAGR